MRKILYNITSGNPRSLVKPSVASLLDGICKIVPAVLILEVFNVIFRHFQTGEPLDIGRMWLVSGVLFAWLLVQYIAYAWAYDKTYYVAYEASARGRTALAERLRHLSLGFFGSRDPGDLTTMILGDYTLVETAISHHFPQLVSGVVLPFLAFICLLFVQWQMALAMFIALPLSVLIIYLTNNFQVRLSKSHIKAKVDAASRLQEYLLGMREIKAHNLSGQRFERLREAFHRLMRESIKIEGAIGPVMMVAIGLMRAGMTLIIFTGAYLLAGGELTLPIFLIFILLGTRVFEPLQVVMVNYAEIKYATVSAERIMEVQQHPMLPGQDDPPEDNRIEFDNVTFAYEDRDVLKNISFAIEPRTITALVGPSGSGKSTVARLIARFWDVQGGSIRLGGKDIKEIDPEKLLSRISMVFQDVYLFKDTIGNNIRVGRIDASQDEIEEAARQACAHDFITALPQGYDTPVGEGGCTLSGGEKQRVSIARALLKDAPIVLLDEATASLDPENETNVQRALNALVTNKTVVTIAHRLKTVRGADKILVLDKASVVEEGKHDDLLSKEGLYHQLWTLQQQSAGWRMKATT
ncbi:MAG: ABC transporter ATP-binding protein [Dehalococcoidia bacterium]|jgi:ATP-binding cassette subfamily B protein